MSGSDAPGGKTDTDPVDDEPPQHESTQHERPIRHAARVVLVDERGATLLLQGFDPPRRLAGRGWNTPGGGLEAGESYEQAGLREVAEETGLRLPTLGEPVLDRESTFRFEGAVIRQHDRFFIARTTRFDASDAGWTALERRATAGMRRWTPQQLATTSETVYPVDLLALLASSGPTSGPVEGSSA